MFRFSFLKLIDDAILPAFLVVGTKVISFLLLALTLGLSLDWPADLYSFTTLSTKYLENTSIFIQVSSISSLFTLLTILFGFGWVVIKAHHFHASHLHPKWQQLFSRSGWEHLIQDSQEIYHQSIVWFTLSWGFFFYCLVATFIGLTFWWVPLLATAVVFSLTMLMLEDFLKEKKILKDN